MILFRSLLYFASLIISTTLYGLLLSTIGWFLPFDKRSGIANQWARINLKLQKSICGLDYRVTGLENIPASNTIVLSKHQSAWETIALRCILPPSR
ncbi:MAG TPA: 1-acyl-sn-glycerol-3-phosphate acyltransferase, partial [Gammaproteobacteria bacterium]|nr:1-acyl-sn-glycerol-3-phosphate acyltransferase [Gammaproteobacteria bacterium]